ncbi:MAG: hypothetical protein K8R37_07895 [Bacteroidales bacterium]|nr:hypothetical protein [Bacteroidales bacterium]
MKTKIIIKTVITLNFLILLLLFIQCNNQKEKEQMPDKDAYKIIFLHHSTGMNVWKGQTKGIDKIKNIFSDINAVPEWFIEYNKKNGTNYYIKEQAFPKGKPYGWKNYPYDYYNIWVKHAGNAPYKEEPTLESLTKEYDFIIFKHCFPVSKLTEDTGKPDINSEEKSIENYKLQYEALKNKMLQFPKTKFLVWTGAALVESKTNVEQATRTKDFFDWVRNDWDTEGDNIFLWDFYELETEGGLFLKDEYARNSDNSHPNAEFAGRVAPLFCQRIVDIIETNGKNTSITGIKK